MLAHSGRAAATRPPPILSPAAPVPVAASRNVTSSSSPTEVSLPNLGAFDEDGDWIDARPIALDPPLVAAAATALGDDTPREILLHVCRFLGEKELAALAGVAVRFALPSDCGGEQASLSVVAEAARDRVAAGWPAAQRAPGQTWLRLLVELGSQRFTSCGPDVQLQMNGHVACNRLASWQCAVVGHDVRARSMSSGSHYLELEVLSLHGIWGAAYMFFGVVRDDFEVAASQTFQPMYVTPNAAVAQPDD